MHRPQRKFGEFDLLKWLLCYLGATKGSCESMFEQLGQVSRKIN